ncbi:MAG: hypothetical protein JSV78_05760 [Phycisphaerales bacterium]|nr:MAG: hypothetical protein JSV78_05760 [Phycisphaerales bacterium]
MARLEVYSHSGRLGAGVIVVPLAGIIAAVVLGIAYSYADVYSPVAGYISLVLVFVAAFAVGYVVSFAAFQSKSRNTKFVGLMGFLTGLLTLYTSWATFTFALLQRASDEPLAIGLVDVFASPGMIWAFARAVSAEGWYEIFGGTPQGITLWVIWLIEACVIIVVSTIASRMALSNRVFCEDSGQWCEVLKNRFRLAILEDKETLQRLVEGDLEAMAAFPPVEPSDAPALRVDLHRSDDPQGTKAMQIKLVKLTEEKGKVKEDTDSLTPIYLLSPEQYERVEALAQRDPAEYRPPETEAAMHEAQSAVDSQSPASS